MLRLVRIVGSACSLLVLLSLGLSFLIDANTFRPTLEAKLSEALARRVKLGELHLKILAGAVTASDLSIAEDPAYGKEPFLHAQAIRIGVEIVPLIFSRRLNVTRLVVEKPRVQLIQSASGNWNFSTLGSRDAAAPKTASAAQAGKPIYLSVKLVSIEDGRFSVGRSGRPPLVLEKVNLDLRNFSATTLFPFSFRASAPMGGAIRIEGSAGPLNNRDMSRTPLTAKLEIDKWSLDGWGIVSLDGEAQSDGSTARLSAKLRADQLKLADHGTHAVKPVEFDFAAEHQLADGAGQVTKGDLRIGAAPARLGGSYAARGESTVLHLTLNGANMPVPELAALLPAFGIALPAGSSLQGGTATVKLAMDGPVNRLVTAGTISLSDTTLGGFDLGRKMAAIQALTGIGADRNTTIQTLAAAIRLSSEGAAAENLQLVVPSIGEMAGGGTISPANALDFRMTARVAGQSIPFLVGGTTADPAFRPDVKAVVTEKAKGLAGGLLKGLLNRKKN